MKLKVGIKSFTVKTIPFLFKRKNKSQVSSIPNKIKLTFKKLKLYTCTWQIDRLKGMKFFYQDVNSVYREC